MHAGQDLPAKESARPLTEWDSHEVTAFLSRVGLSQYEELFEEHEIDGEALVDIQHEELKDIGIVSAGHRLTLLKRIYELKREQLIPLDEDSYRPQSESLLFGPHSEPVTSALLEEIKRLSDSFAQLREEVAPILKMAKEKPLPTPDEQRSRQGLSRAQTYKKSPQMSSSAFKDQYGGNVPIDSREIMGARPPPLPDNYPQSRPRHQPQLSSSSKMFKNFKISPGDTCRSLLVPALKSYNVEQSAWEDFGLFLCYDDTSRLLAPEEKPLPLIQALQQQGFSPRIMVRKLDGTRGQSPSPILGHMPEVPQRPSSENFRAPGNPSRLSVSMGRSYSDDKPPGTASSGHSVSGLKSNAAASPARLSFIDHELPAIPRTQDLSPAILSEVGSLDSPGLSPSLGMQAGSFSLQMAQSSTSGDGQVKKPHSRYARDSVLFGRNSGGAI